MQNFIEKIKRCKIFTFVIKTFPKVVIWLAKINDIIQKG